MNALFRFLASPAGRVVRVVAGIVLIAVGLFLVQGVGGWILAIIGLVEDSELSIRQTLLVPTCGVPLKSDATTVTGLLIRRACSHDL